MPVPAPERTEVLILAAGGGLRPVRRHVHFLRTFDGRWWTAEAPFLRGAYSQGRTRAGARRNLLSAIRDLLDTYTRLGEAPRFAENVEVEIADVDG